MSQNYLCCIINTFIKCEWRNLQQHSLFSREFLSSFFSSPSVICWRWIVRSRPVSVRLYYRHPCWPWLFGTRAPRQWAVPVTWLPRPWWCRSWSNLLPVSTWSSTPPEGKGIFLFVLGISFMSFPSVSLSFYFALCFNLWVFFVAFCLSLFPFSFSFFLFFVCVCVCVGGGVCLFICLFQPFLYSFFLSCLLLPDSSSFLLFFVWFFFFF